jgi:2-polyprenyl-3-methyl-5-hydroxy-6-metoxy-1,4-benzoquinol methylase
MSSDRDWRKWGRSDPYFGVVSWPEFRTDRLAENIDRFFETGRRDVLALTAQIDRLYGDISTSRALDFGCGVGRYVLPLSEKFDHVVGVDISEDMIAEARTNCDKANVRNVDFVISDDALSAVGGAFDLVHSYIVLQHISVQRGLALTKRMLDLLNPGGVAALHYSINRTLSPSRAIVYGLQHHAPFGMGRVAANLVKRSAWDAPTMDMNQYSVPKIVRLFEESAITDIVIVPEWQESVLTARVFGRKAVRP